MIYLVSDSDFSQDSDSDFFCRSHSDDDFDPKKEIFRRDQQIDYYYI